MWTYVDLSRDWETEASRARPAVLESASRDVAVAVLNQYCICGHRCVHIERSGHDKPVARICRYLDFSLSHSYGRYVVAVARSGVVGVDVELPKCGFDWQSLIDRAFSPRECEWILSREQPSSAFWRLWTIKEAALKATGHGLRGLRELEFGGLQAGAPVTVASVDRRYVLNVSTFWLDRSYVSVAHSCGGKTRFRPLDWRQGAEGPGSCASTRRVKR